MPRMRTINAAFQELKSHDPETAITPHCLRQLCLTGKLPHHRIGVKILLDFDCLLDYLKTGEAAEPNNNVVGIRPINERAMCRP